MKYFNDPCLVVGGPHDGQRHQVPEYQTVLKLAVYPKLSEVAPIDANNANEPVEYSYAIYTEEKWAERGERYRIFRHGDVASVMRLLIDNYPLKAPP